MDSKSLEMEFHGPYKWYGSNSIFLQPESEKFGIYLWAVPIEDNYLVYYVGETGVSFADRILDHTRNYLNGLYRVYEPTSFVKGEKTLVWEGMWKKELGNPTWRMALFLGRYQELCKVIYDFHGALKIFLVPFESEKRIRQRIEAAISKTLLNQPEVVGEFQDKDIKYVGRRPDEEPIQVTIKSGEKVIGLPKELAA
jgi:hypothetical protein